MIVGGFFLSVDSSIYVVAVVDKGEERKFGSGRREKGRRKEGKKGGMEEWKEIGFCTTTTYYCYYYILLLIPLSTCYLLLQLPVLCFYAIREFSRWTSNGIWDIYNLLFSMVFHHHHHHHHQSPSLIYPYQAISRALKE